MSADSITIHIDFGDFAGKYHDWFTKGEVEFTDKNEFVLGPWQYNLFVK